MTRRIAFALTTLLLLLLASAAFGQDWTPTANLGLKKPNIGSTNWGLYVNQDFDTIDAAIGVFKGGFVTVPFSSTPNFNLTLGNTFQITLTGAVTSSTVNQPFITKGQIMYLIVCQDGAGGHAFAFPSSFQTPVPSITTTASKCTDTTWQWNGSIWISAGGGGGGGGGGTPSPPDGALQKTSGTSFVSSSATDNGVTFSVSEPVALGSTLNVTGATTMSTASVGGTGIAGSASGTATLPANTGTIAELNLAQAWTAGQTFNAGNLLIAPGPLTFASSASTARTATFPDNTGTVSELNLAETIVGAKTFNAATALLNPGPITLASAGSTTRTATFPDNTGTIAELNLAQTWTDHQSVLNGKSIRWFSTNGTNYAGFTGGASTVNLVWLFPSTDSSGTQCLSSNGSLQLSWSACSAGTGTPGGSNTQVQFNNSASFGGSPNLTWVSPKLTIGVATSTTGQLAMTGGTSGTVLITPQATAGSPTLTLPNTTGTFATNATSPITIDAVAGTVACPTCSTNAAALTANQLTIGSGGQAQAALGTLGTTTTVLHGNAGGAPTFAAVNLGTETTGTAAIANGGTGQTTAGAAFNALSPITSTGDLIIGTGVNTASRLAVGTNGLCLVSNGTTANWNSCASGAVGGTASASQGTFWSASSSIAGSANWTYSAATGHSVIQGANAADAFYMKRFTDTLPTGNFLHFQNNAANADIAKLDVNGNLSVSGSLAVTNSSVAGTIVLAQGTAPGLTANAVQLIAPTSVAASATQYAFPGTPANGFIRWTNTAGALAGSLVSASGVGDCTPANKLVIQTNDNSAPTCSSVFPAMFASQGANAALIAPNGSSGTPTFRVLASGDLPPIVLNSTANGGVTNILPIANGGTNAGTAAAAFNNLSPMSTAGAIIYGGTAGAGTSLVAGTATQLLHSGTTPSWSAVSLTADVSGILPIASGGTNASSGMTNTNGVVYSDGTKLVSTAQGGAGTLCLVSVAGATPSFASCSGSTSTSWSNLTAPSGALAITMPVGDNTQFTYSGNTSTNNLFSLIDVTGNTGTGAILETHSVGSSTIHPFQATAQGTSNGVQMSTAGLLSAIGTGGIQATTLNQALNTTSPLAGGGTQTSALTITCTTCVTSGSSIANNSIVVGSGGGQGVAGTTSPNIGTATGTSLYATGIIDGKSTMNVTTTTPCTLGTASANCSAVSSLSSYNVNEHATAANAIVYNLPTAAAGLQYCVANGYNGSAANTGTLQIVTSASGQFIIFTDGTLSATGGNVISTGAAGDAACVVGVDSTHWMLYVQRGSWTKN